jgi:hypothetical protein
VVVGAATANERQYVISRGDSNMRRTPEKDDLYERIKQHLPKSKELTLTIIKGHLLVEERLRALVGCLISDTAKLAEARLSYHQVLCIGEGMHSAGSAAFRFARRLNEVRNQLAHRLDHCKIDSLVDSLQTAHNGEPSRVPTSGAERLRWLRNCIILSCAFLDGVRMAREHVDRREHGSARAAKEPAVAADRPRIARSGKVKVGRRGAGH